MFFGGKMKTMPPKLRSDDGLHTVIRPLAYCKEADIKKYAGAMQFPIIPCNLCGSQPNLQRQAMKELLAQWDRSHPERLKNMFSAIANIVPSHMLDRGLFDFENLNISPTDGDTLFDEARPEFTDAPSDIFSSPEQGTDETSLITARS